MAEKDTRYSDDYVASLLKKDAEVSSRSYASVGLQAYLPKRSTGAAPKPNTRFLRNIIRETDSHNAALLAKEKRESRERQRQLNRPDRRSSREETRNSHHRRSHDVSADTHRRKRRKASLSSDVGNGEDEPVDRESRKGHHRSSFRSRSRSRSPINSGTNEARHDTSTSERRRHRSKSPTHTSRRGNHRREKDHHSNAERRSHERRRRRERSTSASRSPNGAGIVHRQESSTNSGLNLGVEQNGIDSDPLEEIIGPLPPPKVHSKGRGAQRVFQHSAIDTHFADAYDPALDVQPDPEPEDDWDQALEALRDRQKWKQQGAARLKSAGFSDAEIKAWEKGGEKDESDVVWAKKGQGREWDRGKVLDAKGVVDLKPSWA